MLAERFRALGQLAGAPLPFPPPTAGFGLERRRASAPVPAPSAAGPPLSAVPLLAAPLTMDRVALTPGSRFAYQRSRGLELLLSLNVTDAACLHTSTASLTRTLPTPTRVLPARQHNSGPLAGHFSSATPSL